MRSAIAGALLCSAAIITGASAAEVVFPGASVAGLAPPAGMTQSKKFAGFEDEATGSSILFVDMPAEAWRELKTGMTVDALKGQGIEVKGPAREVKLASGEPAVLLTGAQKTPAGVFRKWILIGGGKDATVLITAQSPESAKDKLSDAAIEQALLGVRTRAKLSASEQVDALPFEVKDKASFRVVNTVAGSALLLTEGPQDTVKDFSQPLVIVAGSMAGAPPAAQRQGFARAAFATVANVKDLAVKDEKVDGERTIISGEGNDAATGVPVTVTQVTSFSDSGFIRAILIARTAEDAKYRDRFLKLAAATTPRKAP